MTSDSDDNDNSPYKQGGARIVEDDGGRRIWEGTIRHVKLSLMKTGIFQFSDPTSPGDKDAAQSTRSPSLTLDDDIDDAAEDTGFDPYDSRVR